MPGLIAPPALREGDTLAIVAPAGPVPEERLAAGIRALEGRYKLLISPDVHRNAGFLAGSDARRTEEFNTALRNPDVRGIWAARGGYGCSRIVDSLDSAAFVADPVPIIGFSDVTVLLFWAAKLGVRSIHGPVLTQLGEIGADEAAWVMGLAEGGGSGARLDCQSREAASGRLVGGNLSLLAHLCGSKWQPDYAGTLCILEDVGERPYALDRYLTQLLAQEAGKTLSSAEAVLFGDFAGCAEPGDERLHAIDVLEKRLVAVGTNCGRGLPIGHGERNWAFPFGATAEVGEGGLRLIEAATQV